jgi:hypothetical protein
MKGKVHDVQNRHRDVTRRHSGATRSFVGALLVGGALLAATPAMAKVQWDFSGFASIGAGKLSDDTLEFMDYTGDEWSMDSDSVIALQAIMQAGDRWSVTGQVLAKGFTFGEYSPYEPRLEWLFVSYELTPELRVRGGRLRLPYFVYSESLEIGYSYPWVRPPIEMYANFLEPFANFDGIDLTLQKQMGDFDNEFKIFGGSTQKEYRGRDVNIEKTAGFAVMTRWDEFSFRYCYNWNRMSIYDPNLQEPIDFYHQVEDVATSLNLQGAGIFGDIADTLRLDSKVYQYHGLGAQWEHDAWTVIAERLTTQGPGKQFSFENDGWYLTVAHQIDDWMPYVSIGEYRSEMDPKINRRIMASYNVIPSGFNDQVDELRSQTMAGIDDLSVYHKSTTLGIRYDFHPSAALKLEAEYFNFKSTGQMLFDGSKEEPDHVLATSIVIDVVF